LIIITPILGEGKYYEKTEPWALVREAAESVKTKGLNAFNQMLAKTTIMAALNTELDTHLG
jgi:hypothetical protein